MASVELPQHLRISPELSNDELAWVYVEAMFDTRAKPDATRELRHNIVTIFSDRGIGLAEAEELFDQAHKTRKLLGVRNIPCPT